MTYISFKVLKIPVENPGLVTREETATEHERRFIQTPPHCLVYVIKVCKFASGDVCVNLRLMLGHTGITNFHMSSNLEFQTAYGFTQRVTRAAGKRCWCT
jgi:hypothetical protein